MTVTWTLTLSYYSERMKRLVLVLTLAGCGDSTPPPAPAPELPFLELGAFEHKEKMALPENVLQDVAGQLHYRPRDTEILNKYAAQLQPIKLFTIDEVFGGWERAHRAFFADGGVFDQIYRPAGK